MSTRIYDAFLVRPTHGLKDILALGKSLAEVEIGAYRKPVSDMVKAVFDDKPEAERENSLYLLGCILSESVQSGHRIMNPECSFVVYAVPDGKTGGETGLIESSLIVQFFGVGREARKLIDETPWLVDVHFQNQTDPDERVSKAEWESRELLWDAIFSEVSVPSQVGVSTEIVSKEAAYLVIWGAIMLRIEEGLEKDPGDAYWAVCRGMAEGWYSLVPKTMREQWRGRKPLQLDVLLPRIPAGCSVVIGKTNEEKLQVSFRDAEGVLIHADDSPNLTALEQVQALLDAYAPPKKDQDKG